MLPGVMLQINGIINKAYAHQVIPLYQDQPFFYAALLKYDFVM